MPLYEYECKQCKRHTEKIQKFSDPEITVCPHCGGALERVISAPGFAFKGGGWYADGYGNAKPASAGAEKKSESGTSESKPVGESPSAPASSGGSSSGGSSGKESAPATGAAAAPASAPSSSSSTSGNK